MGVCSALTGFLRLALALSFSFIRSLSLSTKLGGGGSSGPPPPTHPFMCACAPASPGIFGPLGGDYACTPLSGSSQDMQRRLSVRSHAMDAVSPGLTEALRKQSLHTCYMQNRSKHHTASASLVHSVSLSLSRASGHCSALRMQWERDNSASGKEGLQKLNRVRDRVVVVEAPLVM